MKKTGTLAVSGLLCATMVAGAVPATALASTDDSNGTVLAGQSLSTLSTGTRELPTYGVKLKETFPDNGMSYICVFGETPANPKIEVSVSDDDGENETILTEGVDYVRDGWYRYVSPSIGEQLPSAAPGYPITGAPSEEGRYFYQVRGIGKYTGISQSQLYYAESPYNFDLFKPGSQTVQRKASDPWEKVFSFERKSTTGKKVKITLNEDFVLSDFNGPKIYKNSWDLESGDVIAPPNKPGIYRVYMSGIGDYWEQGAFLRIAAYEPVMTYNLPTLSDDYARNTKIKSFTTGSKVKRIYSLSMEGCSKLSKFVVGKNVDLIENRCFQGCDKLKTLTIKSAKLVKANVRNSLSGSSVTTVKVDTGNKAKNKKVVKAYKKIFTKANCGKKVTVK